MGKSVGRYSDQIREQAAVHYAINGNISKVARDMNINRLTVQEWKDQEWWAAIIDTIHHEKADEHIANYTKIVDKAQRITLEKLDDCTAAQASLVSCQAQDKGLLLAGKPTSISGKSETMESLAGEFIALAKAIKGKQLVPKSKIIEHKD